jgi:demethylmenaquinone methyltransferase / 2-methoxy-6-polyprenyl-1,4-benzoquinol methylase
MKSPNTEHGQRVQAMFGQIATRYDLMNRLMTGGFDQAWRSQVIQLATLPSRGRLLDIGAGTGDLARQALRQYPEAQVVAADFTLAMMKVGKHRVQSPQQWSSADALALPFGAETFDAVVSGFLLRNVSDLAGCLAEQWRVLRPGGKIVALDTTPPAVSILTPLIQIHLHTIIPLMGKILTGDKKAYQYLPDTTEHFLEPERLAYRLAQAGFHQVRFRRQMFGTVAIYWGIK